MNDEHSYIDDLLPGYVLDALDAAEQERVRRHLDLCPECRQMAESDRAAAGFLAFAVAPLRPPTRLKARLIGHIVLESGSATARTPAPVMSQGGLTRRLPGWLLVAALVPWVLVAGLGAEMMISHSSATAPGMTVARLDGKNGASGRMALTKDGTSALLTVMRLPALPPHMMYVCWLERHGAMEPVTAFHAMSSADDAVVMLRTTHPLREYSAVDISMETTARPPHPTGTLLATGRL